MAKSRPNQTPILIPHLESFEEVRQVLGQQLNQLQQTLLAGMPITSFDGSRLSDIGAPQQPNDAVNLAYLLSQALPASASQIQQSRGTSTGNSLTLMHEKPLGTIDGTSTTFRLSYTPLSDWLVLHLDNALEDPLSDYTLSSNAIVYTSAPQVGDNHHAWYFRDAGATSLIITPTTAVSAASAGKTLYIGTGTAPATWQTPAYSDSTWTAPVLQTNTIGAPAVIAGTVYITAAASTGTAPDNSQFLHRQQFVLGSGAVASALLQVIVDNWLPGVWVNGTSVFVGGTASGFTTGTITIPTGALLTGTNLLAFEVKNQPFGGNNPISLDFKLSVT